MTVQFCTHLFGNTYRFFIRPYEEARRQYQYAFFQQITKPKDLVPPSLPGRVTHLTVSLLLLFPPANFVFYTAMRYFEWDSGRQFCSAIEEGNLSCLDFYLQIGWNPNQYFRGKPLIFIAYENNRIEILERLLKEPFCKLDVFCNGKTLMHLAAAKEDFATVELLLQHGASTQVKQIEDQKTPALIAYETGNSTLALRIIDEGYLVNQLVDSQKNTLLNHAWEKKDDEMIIALIKRGAESPKHHAIPTYDLLCIIYEKEKGLIPFQMVVAKWDMNRIDADGRSLLEYVVEKEDWKFARQMVQNGAHIDTIGVDGSRVITFSKFQYEPRYYKDFLGDETLLPKGVKSLFTKNMFRGDWLLHHVISGLVKRAKKEYLNPLEIVFFTGSETALQRLASILTYSEFIHYLVSLRAKYQRRIQIDWIVDALYEVNPRHYREFDEKPDDRLTIERPEKHVFFQTIVEEFKNLGTLTATERTFQGKIYSQEELERGLESLIRGITHREDREGLPSNKAERKALYKNMEKLLRQIVYHLRYVDLNPATKKEALRDLAYASYCVRDWDLVLYQVYCMLADREYQFLTFSERVANDLGMFRLELLKNHIYKGSLGEFNYALSKLKESRKLPTDLPDPEDVPVDINRTQVEEEKIFDKQYIPSHIVMSVLTKRKKDEYFRNLMIDYFRDVVSRKWIEAPFSKLKKEVNYLSRSTSLTPQQVQDLFRRHQLEVPLKFDGRETTMELALNHTIFHACYEKVEWGPYPEDTLPLGTAKMLEVLGILRPKNMGIFQQSFERTFLERYLKLPF